MFKKMNRLSKTRDFQLVFKKGRLLEDDFLKIKWISNELSFPRFGIVVSKKFSSRATERNLIKRRLRAAINLFLPKVKSGFDAAIWPKISLRRAKFRLLQDSLERLLLRSRLLVG